VELVGIDTIWFATGGAVYPPSASGSTSQLISGSTFIKFYFEETPQTGGYNLELDFSNGCTLTD
jgi:hypothetical protein